ncbi:hypothetical protein WJ542_06170 [Paraburkholderia sp. B3]|uniref:hypothetical protein n=1 Tax=Paraburkholderia sp. B3 TaxID=3134791 RepID=UPI003981CAEC
MPPERLVDTRGERLLMAAHKHFVGGCVSKDFDRTPVGHKPFEDEKIVDVREIELFQRPHTRVCGISAEKRTKRDQIARFVKVCPQIKFRHNRREIDILGRECGSSDNDSEISRYLHL